MVQQHAYESIAEALRSQILDGVLKPGDYLPSEHELVDTWKASRGTVRRAVADLVAEGLVVARHGKGYRVAQNTPLTFYASEPERNELVNDTIPVDTWSKSVARQGFEPSERITAEIVYATERIGAWLQVPARTALTVRRRLRYVNGAPYSIADSYYPRSIVGGTEVEEPADVQPGVYAVFERLNRAWVRTTDLVVARMPTRAETTMLHVPKGVAVIEVVRRSFDADGVAVRLTLIVLPGDRHVAQYELEAAT